MSLKRVSSAAVSLVYDRISDAATGLNPGIVANAANYGLPTFMSIDFTNPKTVNFFLAQIDADQMEETGIFRYPLVCLYALDSSNANWNKFTQFSGPVRVVIDVYLSWAQTRPPRDMDSYASCVEDVIYDVINRTANQNWGNTVSYNGDIKFRRAPIRFAAQNFRQQVACAITFGVNH